MKTCHALVLFLIALQVACSNVPTPELRRQQAFALAQQSGWQPLRLDTQSFQLQALLPARAQTADTLTLYIEGDGLAWLNARQPSADPTPINPVALRLALAQPEGAAAYLARPCQFIARQPDCRRGYWTDARFSEEVIDAMGEAVDRLKSQVGARHLVLVGYSGGAAVALLLAARRDDVGLVASVAGNLDHVAWTTHHKVSPLRRSLNPAGERVALATVAQMHWVGSQDRITPPALGRRFVAGFPAGAPVRLRVLDGYDHGCCWEQAWPQLWREQLAGSH